MLITKKKQAAASSHLIVKDVPYNARDRAVAEKAQGITVANIMTRNPRLPRQLVEKCVAVEMLNAYRIGRLYTAKELAEIEEKVYTQVIVKRQYSE